jgi:hypothetical protein
LSDAYKDQQGYQPIHLELSERECRRLINFFRDSYRWTLGILGHQKVSDEIIEIRNLLRKLGRGDEDYPCLQTLTGILTEYIIFNPEADRTDDPEYLKKEEF